MNPSFLKSSRFPISRTASSVGDSDNLDGRFSDPVNHSIGETSEHKSPRSLRVHRPNLGFALDLTNGVIKFRNKSICRGGIALSVPLVRRVGLGDRLGMESNVLSGHRIVRGSGGAPPTKVLSLPGPDLFRRYDARSLYSMPIQRLHRLNRPNCPAGVRLERHALPVADPTLLSRASDEQVSCLKIIRLGSCRQSQERQADQLTIPPNVLARADKVIR